MDTVELAIDGFPLDPGDPDFRFQREVSSWLELERIQGLPVAFRFDSPAEWARWLRPAVRRFAWVRSHRDLIASDRKLDFRLAHLVSHVVNRMQEPGLADEHTLAELAAQAASIDAAGAGSMFRADTARILLGQLKTGIRPATRENLHAMLRSLSPEDRFGGMHELAWSLFLDFDHPDACEPSWSVRVRSDLRALKPVHRKRWIGLLKLALIRKSPDAKWEQKVRAALERIGREDWVRSANAWEADLNRAESIALGRSGQILLRHIAETRKAMESKPEAAPSNDDLIGLLRQGSYAGFEQVVEYTNRHGYQPRIVEAVREYHKTLHGSVADQARRQHVGWWLWLEDVTPIKSEECWSSIVREDLRGFTGARKQAWRQLIGNMTFAVVTKPPAKWVKAAQSAFNAIDPADFRKQILRWMEPLRSGKPLRLSTPGRDVLRCLIWDCALAGPDAQIQEALSWIGSAQWKNKESRDRLSKIAGPLNDVLSVSHPEGVLHVSQPAPQAPDLQAAMNRALTRILGSMSLGDQIEMHPDHISVRGERDHYRIGMDGVVTRRSGRRVRVDFDALPPYLTQLIHPAIDGLDLAQGMFQPNQMHLFSLATILAHDAQWESAIE